GPRRPGRRGGPRRRCPGGSPSAGRPWRRLLGKLEQRELPSGTLGHGGPFGSLLGERLSEQLPLYPEGWGAPSVSQPEDDLSGNVSTTTGRRWSSAGCPPSCPRSAWPRRSEAARRLARQVRLAHRASLGGIGNALEAARRKLRAALSVANIRILR